MAWTIRVSADAALLLGAAPAELPLAAPVRRRIGAVAAFALAVLIDILHVGGTDGKPAASAIVPGVFLVLSFSALLTGDGRRRPGVLLGGAK